MIISVIFIIFLGLAGGVAVGSGFVAFLTVLGIIPRLTQLTKTKGFIQAYEWAVILGAVFGGWESLNMSRFFYPNGRLFRSAFLRAFSLECLRRR